MGARAESARRPGRPGADTPAVPEEGSVLLRGLEAFAELGYDRASARELARRLGVSHNFINDRYGSKAAFWRAVVDSAMGVQLASLPERDPSVDDAENLRRLITDFYRGAAGAPWSHGSSSTNSTRTPSGWTTSTTTTSASSCGA